MDECYNPHSPQPFQQRPRFVVAFSELVRAWETLSLWAKFPVFLLNREE